MSTTITQTIRDQLEAALCDAQSAKTVADAIDSTVNVTTGDKTFGGDITFEGDIAVAGDITHTGTHVGFFSHAVATQPTAVGSVTITYTTNNPSITPNGAVTVADGSSATAAELLELIVEVNAKVNSLVTKLQGLGLLA